MKMIGNSDGAFKCLSFVVVVMASLASSFAIATREVHPTTSSATGTTTTRMFSDCKKLRDLEYGFFGIRTTYSDARNFLRRSDEDDLPESFDDDSMQEEHKSLKRDGCQPESIYLIGRHSATFPNLIRHYERLIQLVFRLNAIRKPQEQEQQQQHYHRQQQQQDNQLIDYLTWQPSTLEMTRALNELGAAETRKMAARFKRLYPELFNTQTSDVKFGFLNETRLEWTAREFLKEVDDQQVFLPECLINDHQVCSAQLQSGFANSFLDFDTRCERLQAGEPQEFQQSSGFELNIKMRIAQRVAVRLSNLIGGSNEQEALFTIKTFDSIYRICKHESALYNDSIWCHLFDKLDFQALEYLEDLETYFNEGYGQQIDLLQSCPLVKDLLDGFESIKSGQSNRRSSSFYFTHINALRRLYATFGLFRDDQSYGQEARARFEQTLEVPQRRNWRSSVQVPYSGNMAFVLYRCRNDDDNNNQNSTRPVRFKVLATVNEQPVELPACGADTECDLDELLEGFKKWRDQCDLDQICPNQGDSSSSTAKSSSSSTKTTQPRAKTTYGRRVEEEKTPKAIWKNRRSSSTRNKTNNGGYHSSNGKTSQHTQVTRHSYNNNNNNNDGRPAAPLAYHQQQTREKSPIRQLHEQYRTNTNEQTKSVVNPPNVPHQQYQQVFSVQHVVEPTERVASSEDGHLIGQHQVGYNQNTNYHQNHQNHQHNQYHQHLPRHQQQHHHDQNEDQQHEEQTQLQHHQDQNQQQQQHEEHIQQHPIHVSAHHQGFQQQMLVDGPSGQVPIQVFQQPLMFQRPDPSDLSGFV